MKVKKTLAAGICLLAFAGVANAGNGLDPSRLPQCQTSAAAETCRLPLQGGQFDSLDGWNRQGLPTIGKDETGNNYTALYVGAGVSQSVFAHFGLSPQDLGYALRFRVRADRNVSAIRATLAMSDSSGSRTIPLGETTTMAQAGEWNIVELVVNGTAFAAPAHVLVSITSEGGDIAQVDDVTLVQTEGAGPLRR